MTATERLEPLRKGVLAAALLLLLFDAFAILAGEAPLSALWRGLGATWGTGYGIGQVLFKATPLMFSACAFQVAFRAGLFNIGVEGQLAVASFAVGYLGSLLPAALPGPVGWLLLGLIGIVFGGLWAAIVGGLRARFGGHEVIGSIMLNRIAAGLLPFLLTKGLGQTSSRTKALAAGLTLPRLSQWFGGLKGSAGSVALVLAVMACIALPWFEQRTRLGRSLKWVGQNPTACASLGLPVPRLIFLALLLSGALAGMASLATVVGYKGYYEVGLGAGVGFGGIAVALLARGRGPMIALTALLVATFQQAGFVLNATVPKEVMDVLFAVAILLAAALQGRKRP